jgi:hypothetical protein
LAEPALKWARRLANFAPRVHNESTNFWTSLHSSGNLRLLSENFGATEESTGRLTPSPLSDNSPGPKKTHP